MNGLLYSFLFRFFFSSFFNRFSVNVLLSLCQQSEKRPLAGVVVIGNGQSAHAVAYAGSAMQLPVLWAKGGTTDLSELHPEVCLCQCWLSYKFQTENHIKWQLKRASEFLLRFHKVLGS